jgi:hypothetical protein
VPNLVIFPLFLVTTIFLVVIAVQLRSSRSRRTSPIRHKVRITSSGGTQQVVVDGVAVNDSASIADPALRQVIARAERLLQEVEIPARRLRKPAGAALDRGQYLEL